ncbi:MAG: HlyC/CorC family transporter [Lachnospiraceae bacterium]|nr:HlyC/CorC family transporter [Lachnospiraceae bacterium]
MLFLQIILIALNAVFACAEIAIISMSDTKIAKLASEGDKRAVRLARLTNEPARFLATIQVAITLSGFMGSAFAAENFSEVIVDLVVGLGLNVPVNVVDSASVIVITVILSYFTLVFGELVPKQVAMRKAEPLALMMSALISGVSRVFSPLVSFLTFSTNTILRLFGIDPDKNDDVVSEEEIRMMVDVGSERGTIDEDERDFIENVFEFDDITAENVATHRTDLDMLDINDSMEVWDEIIMSTRHTRYPICDDTADKIVGILNASEYLRLKDKSRENVLKYAVTGAYFVPETIKAATLFKNMKNERQRLAVVLDEYGGMMGVVTLNDLVERLVGDLLFEEKPVTAMMIEQTGENEWAINGSARLDEVSERLGVKLPVDDYETFNGLVFNVLGTMPESGKNIYLETDDLKINILEIKEHQVEAARVSVKKE